MKGFRFEYLFYLGAVCCFCFVLYSVVSQSPDILPPKEYIYVYSEESDQAESQPISSIDTDHTSEASQPVTPTKPKPKNSSTPQSTPIKQYVSTQSPSSVASKPNSREPSSSEESDPEVPDEEDEYEDDVPSKSSSKTSSKASSKAPSKPQVDDTSIININTATQSELMSLSGIGEVLSQRIIETREAIGGFAYIEELMIVPGIGEKSFQKIAARLTV